MPFPDSKRVIYKVNPIDKVICQYRFPPILKVDSEIPAAFQESIREVFPLFSERQETIQEFAPIEKPKVTPDFLELITKSSVVKNYEFSTEDRISTINLTRTYIAFSTRKYERWEEFRKLFDPAISAFNEIYRPPFFTRIGLRYIDIIDRSKLGIEGVEWPKLIKLEFLGLLSSEFEPSIENFESVYEVKLSDNLSRSRIRTSFVLKKENGEKCYVIDSDFYKAKRVAIPDACENLNFLHERATRLIQRVITEYLHNALGPKEI
jgi:uncharacterized protein (TIGR04255 family)